jgi:hypothetical protein
LICIHPNYLSQKGETTLQQEERVTNREAILPRDEDQALVAHTKGRRKRSYFQKYTHQHKDSHSPKKFIHTESHPPSRFQKFQKGQRREKYFSSYQCYHCDKIEHIAKNFPSRREEHKNRNIRNHAHTFKDEEPPTKMIK